MFAHPASFWLPLGTAIDCFLTSVLQASYGVEDPEYAVTQLAQTTMRSELGKLSLDRVFRVSWGSGLQSCWYCLKLRSSLHSQLHLTEKCPLLRGPLASISVDLFLNAWRWILFQLVFFFNWNCFSVCLGFVGKTDGSVSRPSWSSCIFFQFQIGALPSLGDSDSFK